jgi:ABC-type branched-subunit amino acid transport system permease subunit
MIEIPPYRHLAIVPLLAVALASIVAAAIVLHFAVPRFRRHRLYLSAAILGVLCALSSVAFRSARHAGTGTQTTWGWPRMIYGRWVSWEVVQRQEGVHWQGIVENAAFYGAVALLVGSLVLAARRGSAHSARRATGQDR